MGRALKLPPQQTGTLLGCGAAGGLAAIFNAPIASVMFVLEVMFSDFSLRTFTPVVIATVFAVGVFHAIGGEAGALFHIDPALLSYHFRIWEFVPYLLLGVACGAVGFAFSRCLYALEHLWKRVPAPAWLKPALGGVLLGGMGLAVMAAWSSRVPDFAPPPFFANGYPVVEFFLKPDAYVSGQGASVVTLGFLLAVASAKLIGTSVTLSSGGAGGIFAPSLLIGAAVGGAAGLGLARLGLIGSSPAAYALAGMAGVLAGAVHCPLTAFILVFELTRDYKVILPVMLVAITATVVAQLLMSDSIYTLALRQMGLRPSEVTDTTVLRGIRVSQVPLVRTPTVMPGEPAQRLVELVEELPGADVPVCNADGTYAGLVPAEDVRWTLLRPDAMPLLVVAELIHNDLPTVRPDETLNSVLEKFSSYDVESLPVVDVEHSGQILGLITRNRLLRTHREATSPTAHAGLFDVRTDD